MMDMSNAKGRASGYLPFHNLAAKRLKPWHRTIDPDGQFVDPARAFLDHPMVGWCADNLVAVDGKSVLEVGPWEGYYTVELEAAGATRVLSIENTWLNYLKCLHIKNVFGLRAEFLFGDAEDLIGELDESFDLVFLTGVLYHLADPVQFMAHCADRTSHICIWSHYYDANLVAENTHPRPYGNVLSDMFVNTTEARFRGDTYRYHQFRYEDQHWGTDDFAGGAKRTGSWMELPDLRRLAGKLGFDVASEWTGEMESGPVVQMAWRRTNSD